LVNIWGGYGHEFSVFLTHSVRACIEIVIFSLFVTLKFMLCSLNFLTTK